MRRTVRALSLAAAAGTALGVLAPVASASPFAPPERDAAPSATCPPQQGHQSWQGQSGSAEEKEAEDKKGQKEQKDQKEQKKAKDAEAGLEAELDSLETEILDAEEELSAQEHDTLIPDDTDDTDDSDDTDDADDSGGTSADETVPQSGGAAGLLSEEPDTPATDESLAADEPLAADDPLAAEDATRLWESGAGKPTAKPSASHGKDPDCDRPRAPGGVHAGDGGSLTDSVPALAAGGLLIAGAFGAAAHRLLGRRKDPGRHR
ncbi:hypothetical protein GCM10009535_34110 [Streptomyces thermocarboxydovorans]|uniref:Uncharacterized protein n=1 Tax=Streptomyces thermocarboxydovorans TaxID=59298 RepID=A0ABP3SQF0_9ACTN